MAEDRITVDPDQQLGAITVMFRRVDGHDAHDMTWFWVKDLPDGSLDKTPDGMAIAGQSRKAWMRAAWPATRGSMVAPVQQSGVKVTFVVRPCNLIHMRESSGHTRG